MEHPHTHTHKHKIIFLSVLIISITPATQEIETGGLHVKGLPGLQSKFRKSVQVSEIVSKLKKGKEVCGYSSVAELCLTCTKP